MIRSMVDASLALPEVSSPKTIGHARNPAGATFGPRTMTDFEFVWMTDGEAVYVEDGQRHAVPEGAVVLCRRGRRDGFDWDTRRPSRHAFCHFDVTGHEDVAMQGPTVLRPEAGDLLRTSFRHLLTWSSGGDPRLRKSLLRSMLWAFLLEQTDAFAMPADDLPDAVRAVGEALPGLLDGGGDVTLATLADVACVTPEHLCRVFKKATGRTPLETVRLARLDRAADLLKRSNLAVNQVAAAAGFKSPYHFSRRFSEGYGLSPSAYRKRVRAGEVPPLPLLHDGLRVGGTDRAGGINSRHERDTSDDGVERGRWSG